MIIALASFMNHYEMALGIRALLTAAGLALICVLYRDAIKDTFMILARVKRKIRG